MRLKISARRKLYIGLMTFISVISIGFMAITIKASYDWIQSAYEANVIEKLLLTCLIITAFLNIKELVKGWKTVLKKR